MTNLVKFGGYDIEAARSEQEALASEGSADFMKLNVGRNVVRFLPPPPGKRSPFVVTHQHYVEIPGTTSKVVFNCPRMSKPAKPCPVCARAEKLRANGNPVDRDRAYDLFPRRRVFANVIDRSCPEKGPLVLSFGKKIHEALIALRTDEDAGGDFTHPITGFDLVIERKGTGKTDTEYKVMPARGNSKLAPSEAQMQEWIDSQADLGRYAIIHTPEEIKAMIHKAAAEAQGLGGKAPALEGSGKAKAAPAQSIEADVFDAQFKEVEDEGDDIPWA